MLPHNLVRALESNYFLLRLILQDFSWAINLKSLSGKTLLYPDAEKE